MAPVALGMIGFTAGGIAAGSTAASLMSTAAVANGGGVVAGGLVACLQSAGNVQNITLIPCNGCITVNCKDFTPYNLL